MMKPPRVRAEEFKERVSKQLDELSLSSEYKGCILELLEIEFNNPTTSRNYLDVYLTIIRRYAKQKG